MVPSTIMVSYNDLVMEVIFDKDKALVPKRGSGYYGAKFAGLGLY